MISPDRISVLARNYADGIMQTVVSLKEDPQGVQEQPFRLIAFWRAQIEQAYVKGFRSGEIEATRRVRENSHEI